MKWKDIIESPKYQGYTPEQKKETRERFWKEIVSPNIDPSEHNQAYERFNRGADEIEGIKPLTLIDNGWTQELANLDPAFRDMVMHKAQRDKGFLKALQKGKFASTSGRLAKHYAPDTAAGEAVKRHEQSGWQPKGFAEELGYGASSAIWDLPIYAAGGAIGGASGGGNPISTGMGAMGLHSGLNIMLDQKEAAEAEGKEYGWDEISSIGLAKDTGKGIAIGAATGALNVVGAPVAERISRAIPSSVKSKTPEALKQMAFTSAERGSVLTAQTGTMMGMENVLNDQPLTAEYAAKDFMINVLMEMISRSPTAKKKVQDAAAHKGIKAEEIIKKIDPEIVKNPDGLIDAIDQAIFRTEKEIELQRAGHIQDTIIDNQIRSNYKDGKTPQEILQVNQIPKEYRPFILDPTPTGGFKVKDSVYEKIDRVVNQRDITSQKYEDILPGPIRDMYVKDTGKVLNEKAALQNDLNALRDQFKRFRDQKDQRRDDVFNKHIDDLTGNYRRYETLPKVREKMDAFIDYVDSILTPEDKFNIALDPSSLMDHVNYKESGYSQLKAPYQKAVKKEIVAKYINETGFTPPHIIETASRKADAAIKAMEKRIIDEGRTAAKKLDHFTKTAEYKEALKKVEMDNITPEQKTAALRESLKAVEKWAAEEKAAHVVNFKRAMGESEKFGRHSRDNKEFFGETHYADTLEFAKKPPGQIYKQLLKANFLKNPLSFKGWDTTMFLNKSRVAKNYLGQHIYDEFVVPMRQAERNATREIVHEKDWVRKFKKDFKPKERDMMGEYLISLDENGMATLQEAGINPPTWEELSKAQQERVTEAREKLDVFIDRINMARADVGLPPIERRENYVTFLRKFSLAEELGYDPTTISVKEFNNIEMPEHKMKHYASGFLKERLGGTRAVETDLAFIMDTYMNSTIKTIHNTPVIGKLRMALDFEPDFKNQNPNAHEYLSEYLNVFAGKKVSETKGAINAFVGRISRNVGIFVLAYNARSAGIQPTAVVNTIGILGPLNVAKGTKLFMNKKMREFARRESMVLEGRIMDITLEEITRGAKGTLGRGKAKAADIGTMPLRYLDYQTATISWLSAYQAAKSKGLTHKMSKIYADDIVNSTQASASRIDLAPIQHTPIGKAVTLFNTFVINNLNFLREDVVGDKKVYKLVEQGITLDEARAKYGADDSKIIWSIPAKETTMPNGNVVKEPARAVVYDSMRMVDKATAIKRIMQTAAAWTVCNTIYELLGVDENPPLPAPLSAFYEGKTGQTWVDTLKGKTPDKEDSFAGGIHEAFKEMMTVFPVAGGSFVFGGESVYGAVPLLVIDTIKTLSGQPGSKPLSYQMAKWAGVPGGQQVYKMLKQFERAEKEEVKEKRQASPKYIKQQIKKDVIKNNPGLQELQQIRQDINKLKRGY